MPSVLAVQSGQRPVLLPGRGPERQHRDVSLGHPARPRRLQRHGGPIGLAVHVCLWRLSDPRGSVNEDDNAAFVT